MGLINRLIMGSEKSEGYARSTLPSNRWELFWDIFKGRFWKLVLINLLVLMFCIPVVALFLFRSLTISGFGAMSPFSQPFGAGYQAAGSFAGFNESIVLSVNLRLYLLLPIVMAFAALGISGGAYVIRNMVWTEGVFVANDFWRGIKQNYLSVFGILLFFSAMFYMSSVGVAFNDLSIVRGTASKTLLTISKLLIIFFNILIGFMCLHMLTMTVTYKLKARQLLKNSFLFTIGLFPQSVFFALISLVPYLFMLIGGSFFIALGVIIILLLGASFPLLVWTDFSQWAFDKFINDKVPGAQKNRGIYEKIKDSDSASLKKYKEQIEMARSSFSTRPIKPITDEELTLAELPQSFKRSDIEKLNESRKVLYEDNERYIEEHKNDPQFKKTEADELNEKARLEKEERLERVKRELKKRDEKNRKRMEKYDK